MDEFDDIFMDSNDEDHGTTGVMNNCSTKEKEDGGKKADEDVFSIGSSASSSSLSSSSSDDDDSVSSKDDKRNGSNVVNECIGEESDDDGDMLRDELDEDALVEFFSDPTPSKVNGKRKENNDGDSGSFTATTAVDASLDAEELVDLEEDDDSSTEGRVDEDAGPTVQTTQSSSALNKENNGARNANRDYTISYNCEKKASPRTAEIFDESSDEDDSLSTPRRDEDEADASPIAKPKQNSREPVFNPYQKQQRVETTQQQESSLRIPHRPNDSARVDAKTDEHIINGSTKVTSLPDISASSQKDEVQVLRIERSHFKPPAFTQKADPIVHKLSSQNRPIHNRRNIPVNNVFSGPVRNIWQSKFQSFNHMQSEMVQVLANSDDNVIVSAPTGAGKTALFEMAMARLIALNLNGVSGVATGVKVVYIAPNKALCDERQEDWSKRLADVDRGMVCTTITGDANATSSYGEIAKSHLILTTPEKWDSITRRWNDYVVLLGSVKLLLVDEVHMIGEKDRGSCLESVISRMKTIQRAASSRMLTSYEIASSR